MILPRKDQDGIPYISYSQVKLWNEAKGFNTGLPGRQEFIRSYFFGEEYPDKGGYGTFGTEVENYITMRLDDDKFTADELKTLNKIKPLGVFQHEARIDFDGFYLKGYIDDMADDFSKARDYKTASNNSRKKYDDPDYFQLDVYAAAIQQKHGIIPELEVCVIERLGNGFKGGRPALSVGENIWYVKRETNEERLKQVKQYILDTAKEISAYYTVFLKLNQ